MFLSETRRPPSGEWHRDPLTEVATEVDLLKKSVEKLDSMYVTKEEFEPVKKAVYGVIWLVLGTAVLSVLVLIWRTKSGG